MGPEAREENETVARAKLRGWKAFKVQWIGRRGAPDRCFMRPGVNVWIEFKRPGEEPTEQQYRMLDRMENSGFNVWWAASADAAMALLSQYEPGGHLAP